MGADDFRKTGTMENAGLFVSGENIFGVESADLVIDVEAMTDLWVKMGEVRDRSDITSIGISIPAMDVTSATDGSDLAPEWTDSEARIFEGYVQFAVFDDNASSETVEMTVDRREVEAYLVRMEVIDEAGNRLDGARTPGA